MRRTSRLISWPVCTVGVLVLVTGSGPGGCGPTVKADFDSAEPAARNAAIVEAASKNDRAAVPDLVRMLDSDDPATRLLAINALEKITGERMGYDYTAPEHERAPAVDRWQAWVGQNYTRAQGGASATIDAGTPRTSSPPHLFTSSAGGGGR